MTSSVHYLGGLRTNCTHLQSQSTCETDAPLDNSGKGERFSPTDLMATSLAACMITVMGIKAESMQVDLSEVRIDVLKVMKADPRRIGRIELTFHIPDKLKILDARTVAILRNTGETCPVIKSIHPDLEVQINWGSWS